MTRRKDPQPDAVQPETPPPEPFVTELDPTQDVAAAADLPPGPPKPPPPPEQPRQSGILGPVLGGALAAVGGFALSHFNAFGIATPASVDLAPLTAQIEDAKTQQAATLDAMTAKVESLSSRIAKLEAAPPPETPDLSRLDTFDQRLAAIEAMPADGTASTAALTAKIAALEKRIAALPASSSDPALQQKLDDALTRLADAETAATARATEAEAAAKAAARTLAIDALSDAIASGQPFAAQLQAVADPALSTALGPMAEAGVPTLVGLQDAFPDAAREALRTAREISTEDGWGDRLVDFLAAQTGARPLAPMEGATPDAILSRAEFALSEGRVADALTELDSLDPAVVAPLDGWIAQAKAHLAASVALQAARGE
jgi:hypothetical protein